ncbi:ABC transporter ATP-binding protein [Ruminococcus albus]|uniref:ABC transporter ATP-binding protein n=1 Tax=Ruminococcus albus TaxID=1264 RepID=UPI000680C073|nr:ABC transporter ATP-binding protein [Ruminococcus albus]MCC3349658.1 ABC transporter ATP-binding protein [Ruminococcus albus 8]
MSGIDLTIKDGEFIVLTGASGCGKTTVTRLINGLIPHYYNCELSGKVTIDGKSIPDTPIYETARHVGSVFQDPRSQFFNVNTTDEIAFAAENQCVPPEKIEALIKETASALKIEKLLDRSIFELSGGEKQMIACAGVDLLSPDIIVLDEPSSNLDSGAVSKLRDILAKWKSQGKTVIIAEHRLYFLRELADRMLIFENGMVKKELSKAEISALSYSDTEALGIRPLDTDSVPYSPSKSEISSAVMEFKDFRFTYKDGRHGIDIPLLELPANSVIAVIGHNGAGKSTFVRNICGLEKKCKGIMTFGGRELRARERLHHCYMIMQDVNHQLFTESVCDEVILSMTDKTFDDEQKSAAAERILSLLDLADFADTHPMALSGGQKQRTAIAGGIASSKPVMIFDEPTSGLDFYHMKQVAAEMTRLRGLGKAVLIVTHDLEFILSCCDHIVRLEEGHVVENYPLTAETVTDLKKFFADR